ncbi:MAG: hypothetical protein KTR30_23280 [Saprospiraceae bacterium]|nr:hypothetical protein [Saprospiraceae bacterium]
MLLEQKVLSFQGKPLFQRAKFKTPIQVSGSMDDMACCFYMVEGTYEIFHSKGSMRIGPKQVLIKQYGNSIAGYYSWKEDPENLVKIYHELYHKEGGMD